MSNKGRLPALGLGAKRPEQHALVQARLHSRHRYSLVLSFSLSLAILSSRSLLTKGFPFTRIAHRSSLLSPSLPCFVYQGQKTPLVQSVLRQQQHRTSSSLWPLYHQPRFRVIFSICFHLLRVSSMSPSDRRCRLRLQVLPGSSASKTLLLAVDVPAIFRVVRSPHGPMWRALQRTRCRE